MKKIQFALVALLSSCPIADVQAQNPVRPHSEVTPMPKENVPLEEGPFSPSWEGTQDWECPEWYRDAKFGLWAHWSPQCQAESGDWYARHMYFEGHWQYNHHTATYGNPGEYGYKELCRDFSAQNFNPEYLIKRYKDAGAKYFFCIGNHHDGFDMWDSPYQEWNAVNMGPRRDVVGAFADACRKYDMRLGISFHGNRTWTWMEKSQDYDGNLTKEDGVGKWWEGYDPQLLYRQRHERSYNWQSVSIPSGVWEWTSGYNPPSEEFKQNVQNRYLQCINAYNPDIIYFDDAVLPYHGCDEQVGLNIISHYYNHSANQHGGRQEVVATGKVLNDMHKRSMMWDVERGIPGSTQELPWQTCTCIGEWHYDRGIYRRGDYKPAQQVIDMLVDVVSKNGNLLLSIPVRGDGTIDEKEEAIVDGIKAWMDVNGRSIYATRPWKVYGEGPLYDNATAVTGFGFNETNNYSNRDVRYVQRNDTLFATILRWPAVKEFTFKALGVSSAYYNGRVEKVSVLGHGEVDFALTLDGLTVSVPENKTNAIAPVFEITFSDDKDDADLPQIIHLYDQWLLQELPKANNNTGHFCQDKLVAFQQRMENAKKLADEDAKTLQNAIDELNKAYRYLQAYGRNLGGKASAEKRTNLTAKQLVQASSFSATGMGTRFGSPKNWKVENYSIPMLDASKGTKNGIDNYPGYNCLMLGVWEGEDGTPTTDMTDARICRTVHLQPGRYYFGASFQIIYSLHTGYIYAAKENMSTNEIPEKSLAYYPITKCVEGGDSYGIYFDVEEEQDIIVGFQADLQNGARQQEFRVSGVRLLQYDNSAVDASFLVPGRIEAEQWSSMMGIQNEACGDTGYGQNVGWMQVGDWMEYPINIVEEGLYEALFRSASEEEGAVVDMSLDGEHFANIHLKKTGNWQSYTDNTCNLNLPRGKYIMRLTLLSGGYNLNWFKFNLLQETSIAGPKESPTKVADNNTYDLTGRKVTSPANGLYVVKGKKLLVRK